MAKVTIDQATGLRKLLERSAVRVVALVGAQSASLASALAVALVGQGQRVLLLDEQLSAGDRHFLLREPLNADVGSVLQGKMGLKDISMQVAGLTIVPADTDLNINGFELERLRMLEDFHQLASGFDFVVINAGLDIQRDGIGFALAAPEVVVVTDSSEFGITEAYRHIKLFGRIVGMDRHFLVMIRGASESYAKRLYYTLARVCRRYLGFVPAFLCVVSPDSYSAAHTLETMALDLIHTPVAKEGELRRFDVFMCRLLGVRGTTGLAVA